MKSVLRPPPGLLSPDETAGLTIPLDRDDCQCEIEGRTVKLTNLGKIFWPKLGLAKRDLLRYYFSIAPVLLPHVRDRAMVMKRYPNGVDGGFFFMKRAPSPRPPWIEICSIEHASSNVVDFPVVRDLPTLLWLVNLGCIDLNQWYARCDDINRPDYLHFDLDPTPGADFDMVLEAALLVHEALESLQFPSLAKTTGSRGIHIYVPIRRGPVQKEVWAFAKEFARSLASLKPAVLTSEYRVAKRPARRVLIDYNQNAWGRTLASVYSVRPQPAATVSTPVSWEEIEEGIRIEDFTVVNVPDRVRRLGDLWEPLVTGENRVKLEDFLPARKNKRSKAE